MLSCALAGGSSLAARVTAALALASILAASFVSAEAVPNPLTYSAMPGVSPFMPVTLSHVNQCALSAFCLFPAAVPKSTTDPETLGPDGLGPPTIGLDNLEPWTFGPIALGSGSLGPPAFGSPTFGPGTSGNRAISSDGIPPARLSGFLNLEFLHTVIQPYDEYSRILDMVSPDSLGANIQHLEDYGTRHNSSPEVLHAGRWLVKRLLGYGYSDTLLQSINPDDKVHLAPRNVIATKQGVTRPNFRVVIGCHYDSITYGESVSPVIEAPGADDNASGTSGTMEIARLLSDTDLDATVQFALFAAHEQGLYGSLEFVRNLVAEGVPRDKLFFINLDMIGNADHLPWKVRVYTDDTSLPLAQLMGRMFETYTSVVPLLAGNRMADQTSFQQKGYPGIFVHEADFSLHYHSRQDLFIHLEMDYEAEVVRAVLAMVLHLALIADPPTNVAAFETAAGDLRVEWDHSTDADVLRYQVELLDEDAQLLARHSTVDDYLTLNRQAAKGVSFVRVRAEDVLGESDPSEVVFVGGCDFTVQGVTPTPASNECSFDIFIPGAGDPVRTSLMILDASGRLVRSMKGEYLSRGSQTLKWDLTSADGSAVRSGVYFYIVEVEGVGRNGGKIIVVR